MVNNKITIDNSYGSLTLVEPDRNIINEKDVESLINIVESKMDTYHNPKVNVTTYISDEKTINDAMDLTMLAALCCWGHNLYHGGSIKITITAEYCPEDK